MSFLTLSKNFLLSSILSHLRKSKGSKCKCMKAIILLYSSSEQSVFLEEKKKKKQTCYQCHLLITSEVKQKLLLIWNSNWFIVSMKWCMFIFLLSAPLSYRYFSYRIPKKCTHIYTCLYIIYLRFTRGTNFITVGQNNLQMDWFFKSSSGHRKVTK